MRELSLLVSIVFMMANCTKANPHYQPRIDGSVSDNNILEDLIYQDSMISDSSVKDGVDDQGHFDLPTTDSILDLSQPDQGEGQDQSVSDSNFDSAVIVDNGITPDLGTSCKKDWECADDYSCTTDQCIKGHCVNEVSSGCLIDGECVKEKEINSDNDCSICLPNVDKNTWSSYDGKVCQTGLFSEGICVANRCREWIEQGRVDVSVGALSADYTSLKRVDVIDGKEIWAVGEYSGTNNMQGGAIVRLDTSLIVQVRTASALNDIHHKWAVGQDGVIYYFDSGTWSNLNLSSTAYNGEINYVWGLTRSDSTEEFYLTGGHDWLVSRCTISLSGTTDCKKELGIPAYVEMGPIVGTSTSQGGDQLWSARILDNSDHIYTSTGNGNWSFSPAEACSDGSDPACSSLSGDFIGLASSSSEDVWAISDTGRIIHFDGIDWTIKTPSNWDPSTKLTAIYSDKTLPLVIAIGYRDTNYRRYIEFYTYNRVLDEWFGPVEVDVLTKYGSVTEPGIIRHIGGDDYRNLWLVGDIYSGFNGRTYGWVWQLENTP